MENKMNNKVKILIMCLFFCSFIIKSEIFAQGTIGPVTSVYRRDVIVNGNVTSSGLLDLNQVITIGRYGVVYRRAVYQWNIPDIIIPDNSTIDSLHIPLEYSKSDQNELPAGFFAMGEDITDGSQANLTEMFGEMNFTPLAQQTGTSGVMDFYSNDPNNSLNLAFKNTLPNNRFVLGIRWANELADREWFIANSTVTIKVHFTPPQQIVHVDQFLSTGVSVGNIKLYHGNTFGNALNVPQDFNFYINSHQIIRGDTMEYSNQKYNNWNTLPDVRNQHDFLISTGTNNFTSNFQPNYYGIIVRNAIEGLSNKDGGILYFKDPWLIDSIDQSHANTYMNRGNDALYNNINSPLNFSNGPFSNYKGIFLYQEYNPSLGKPCYSVKTPAEQNINLGSSQGTHKFYFQNYSSTGTRSLTQNNNVNGSYETPIVFTSVDAVVNANLKGIQLSNNSSTFSSNSQRKVFSTYSTPECLFQVYESMGSIWMEKSTNGGTTWTLFPTTPLFSSPATAPSLDHMTISGSTQDYIFITCVSDNYIEGCEISSVNPSALSYYTIAVENNNPGNPVVAYLNGNRILVLWKGTDNNGQSGFVYNVGTYSSINPYSIVWYFETEKFITGTNSSSINPTIESLKNDNRVRLAWEENSTIKYCDLLVNSDNSITMQNSKTISNYSGFSTNTKPSIIAVTAGARLTWVGKRTFPYPPYLEQKAVFMDPSNTSIVWSFGNNVQNTAINISPETYSIAWSRSNTDPIQFADSHTLSTITTLTGLTGNDVQLSNGNHDYIMRAVAFNSASAPYFFNNKNLYSQAKQNSAQIAINNGREGIVRKDNCQFFFAVGDVNADNKTIEFIPIIDSTRFYSLDDLNNYLVTNPIQVNNNSQLFYSVQYGITDSLAATNALKGNSFINFQVEILDAATNDVLCTSDNVNFDSLHVFEYDNISYQVNMDGIGNRTIKLRLKVSTNSNIEYSLKSCYSTEGVLLKKQVKNTIVTLMTKVKSYDLSQNYPNPFNPVTTIKYQIPKSGVVTLKVYDILGKEVANLVNEYKDEGKYNINFDASKLASGVYIYQIKANDYISSKKMMLLK